MKKGLIIYDSKTGTTHKFGEEIKKYLKDKGAEVELVSVSDYKNDEVGKADFVLLGGWTSGLFIFLQHPDKPWIKMANDISPLNGKKVGLFTTYKVATGSVFKKMK
ncbi:MAG: flavodoxin domain-containing protein, partial [Bacteroidales bacterium]|nr:flavodoxin domain-containing protein [Bacteroidales bacterium]